MYPEDSPESPEASASNGGGDKDMDNTFKIMVATDSHLGYAEKDAIRGLL
jgi:hypothetical protein